MGKQEPGARELPGAAHASTRENNLYPAHGLLKRAVQTELASQRLGRNPREMFLSQIHKCPGKGKSRGSSVRLACFLFDRTADSQRVLVLHY